MKDTTNTENIVDKLNKLIAIDCDAIAAYEAAVERLENQNYKEQLMLFKQDHENHIAVLSQLISQEGGVAYVQEELKNVLTEGKGVISKMSEDTAILKAMQMNELLTNTVYAEKVEEEFPEPFNTILQNALEDERRHKDWLDATLENAEEAH